MRMDKLLWFLRLAGSRDLAQQWIFAGHIRLNGRRIERPAATVREGDVLVLPMHDRVKIIEVVTLPRRRGPASEAQDCYRVLDATASSPLARPETDT